MKTSTLALLIIISLVFAYSVYTTNAHNESEHEEIFAAAEALIAKNASCNQLTAEQLEIIGEYYMEQMHPGELHEQMDAMMGGDGSEQLRQMHITMAQRLYCGDSSQSMMGFGMMGSMAGGMMNSMMNGNDWMMEDNVNHYNGGMHMMNGYGMLGTSWWAWSFWWLFSVAVAAFIFGLIFWWTYKLVIKESLVKEGKKKR